MVEKFEEDFEALISLTFYQQSTALAHFHGALSDLISDGLITNESVVAAFTRALNCAKASPK